MIGAPFHWTWDPLTKFVPTRFSVRALLPAVADVGEMLIKVGAGLFTVKVCPVEVPPPGLGVKTVTVAVPALVRFPAGIVALRWVASV